MSRPRRRIVLATVGTLGDVHPFLALGGRLAQSGWDPVLAAAPEYELAARGAGLGFACLRPGRAEVLQSLGIDSAELARRVRRNPAFLFRELLFPQLQCAWEDALQAVRGSDVVLTSSLAWTARYAAERAGIAHVGVVLQPMMFLSAHDPPVLAFLPGFAPVLRAVGPRVAAVVLRSMQRAVSAGAAPLQRLRRELGLAAVPGDPLFAGQFTGIATLALYSRVLGGMQPDYPPRTCIAGFQFHEADAATAEDAARLARFLAAGPAPVVFTLGSFETADPGAFFLTSIAAARATGRRAVLLAGESAGGLRAYEGHDLLVCGYVPYRQVFPHATAVVHQGGVGTVAQCLRAGRPQLVVPCWADQPDNAARVVRAGAGHAIARRRYAGGRASRALAQLLADARCAARARVLAGLVEEESAADAAGATLEALVPGG